jgi:DNA-binding transcriptional ArsR family regulator
MPPSAAQLNLVLSAVADPRRRAILGLLRDGERSVNDIAGHFRVSRPAVSKHLRVLRGARLVSERRDGRRRLCRLAPEPLSAIDMWLADYRHDWRRRLQGLKSHVERSSTTQR